MGNDTADAPAEIGRERGSPPRQDIHRRRFQRPRGSKFRGGVRRRVQPVDLHPPDDQSTVWRVSGRVPGQPLRPGRLQRHH